MEGVCNVAEQIKQGNDAAPGDPDDGSRSSAFGRRRTFSLMKATLSEYNMKNRKRGICVIINQRNFSKHTGLNERHGTDLDADSLSASFRALSFEVLIRPDLDMKQLDEELERWQTFDHSECDAFVFCYLSHGERDFVYTTDGKISADSLFESFTGDLCPTLLGKPKLFFIQACRGDRVDQGAAVEADSPHSYRLPSHADFLICYSTVSGYFSWRNAKYGSWFIQALCDVLDREELVRKLDILALMTLVNQRVAVEFESYVPDDPEMNQRKQIPCMTSTLIRKLMLTAKYECTNV